MPKTTRRELRIGVGARGVDLIVNGDGGGVVRSANGVVEFRGMLRSDRATKHAASPEAMNAAILKAHTAKG